MMAESDAVTTRDVAARLGAEADEINEVGEYVTSSGKRVSLVDELKRTRQETKYVPPDEELREPLERRFDTKVEVRPERTLQEAQRLKRKGLDPVILNFASGIAPGGGYRSGSRAQEESIAWSSGLVPALEAAPEFYELHRKLNDPHHTDAMIYSPDVPVFRDEDGRLSDLWTVAMISAVAPRVPGGMDDAAKEAFWRRIPRVLRLGLREGHDSIVLGAWGCGAFNNDPKIVASIFREAVDAIHGAYAEVVFAIVDSRGTGANLSAFRSAFE